MNTQELRRLGVLPYEDAPRQSLPPRNPPAEAWFAPVGFNRGEVVENFEGMTVTRHTVQAQSRTLRDNWTIQQSPEIVNLVSDELAEEITAEINNTVQPPLVQPNPFDEEDFEDMREISQDNENMFRRIMRYWRS